MVLTYFRYFKNGTFLECSWNFPGMFFGASSLHFNLKLRFLYASSINTFRFPTMTKRVAPSKYWVFTWNNYPDMWESMLLAASHVDKYIFGKEVGESGTPHIQGYIEFSKKVRPTTAVGIPAIHWEKRRGTAKEAIEYCTKDGDYVKSDNCRLDRPLRLITDLRPWQQSIVDIVGQEPDDRTVYWYWDEKGNTGKSALCKLLVAKHDAIICGGKATDMKYLIVKYREKHGVWPELVIFDIPRTILNYVSYTGIEEIKNGCFASTKYECDMVLMNSPHVLCFANERPNESALSSDRWNINHIASI